MNRALLHPLDDIALGLVKTLRGVVIIFAAANAGLVIVALRLAAQFIATFAQGGFGLGGLFAQARGLFASPDLQILLEGVEVVLDNVSSLGDSHDALRS